MSSVMNVSVWRTCTWFSISYSKVGELRKDEKRKKPPFQLRHSKKRQKKSKEFCKTVTMLNGCWISDKPLSNEYLNLNQKHVFISMLKKLKGRMYHIPLLNEGTSTWRLDIFLKKVLKVWQECTTMRSQRIFFMDLCKVDGLKRRYCAESPFWVSVTWSMYTYKCFLTKHLKRHPRKKNL